MNGEVGEGRERGRKERSKERMKNRKKKEKGREGERKKERNRGREGKRERKRERGRERKSVNGPTYQAYENTKELNNIRVGHRVETTHQGVQSGNERRDDDRSMHIDVNDHTDSGS